MYSSPDFPIGHHGAIAYVQAESADRVREVAPGVVRHELREGDAYNLEDLDAGRWRCERRFRTLFPMGEVSTFKGRIEINEADWPAFGTDRWHKLAVMQVFAKVPSKPLLWLERLNGTLMLYLNSYVGPKEQIVLPGPVYGEHDWCIELSPNLDGTLSFMFWWNGRRIMFAVDYPFFPPGGMDGVHGKVGLYVNTQEKPFDMPTIVAHHIGVDMHLGAATPEDIAAAATPPQTPQEPTPPPVVVTEPPGSGLPVTPPATPTLEGMAWVIADLAGQASHIRGIVDAIEAIAPRRRDDAIRLAKAHDKLGADILADEAKAAALAAKARATAQAKRDRDAKRAAGKAVRG